MTAAEKPLTKRELARLFRAFAHMLEQSEETDAAERPTPRARRRAANDSPAPFSDTTVARADAALRKLGVKP